MGNCIRTCVSKKKKRLVIDADGTDGATGLHSQNGVNLDLSLVHKNIVAMGFPAQNFETCYRNPRDDVIEFLDENFGKSFRVYNLCSESDRQYDPVIFGGRVCSAVQWPDHLPPTLGMLRRLVLGDCAPYLRADPKNVAVIHCKAGKGRTGTAVCCLLLAQGAAADHEAAITTYGLSRTQNGKGMTIPSQIRYIKYFDLALKREIENQKNESHNNKRVVATAADIDDEVIRPNTNNNVNGDDNSRQESAASPTSTHSRIRLESLQIKGFKYVHLLRRNPETGTTGKIFTLKNELVETEDSNPDDELPWFHVVVPQSQTEALDRPQVEPTNDSKLSSEIGHEFVDETGFTSVDLQQDFCLAFGNDSTFPSKCMMLWLHADFCCSDDDSQKTFKAGEIDGWKMFFEENKEVEIVRLSFSKLE